MPEWMKMLLVIVFAALTYEVTSEEIQMDMALNAVDDQYFQCQDEMLANVLEVFLVTEVKEKVDRVNEKSKEIVLTSLRTFSNNNCLLFSRPTPASTTSSTGPRGISPQQFSSNISKLVTISLAISLFTRTK
ncbi:hypothetical protein DPEC_G00186920 [Dallia pectoralis]|uniref:Uncharacterized protein n=1 Tax=Dallia pectoralis TaxID=75939 RepID=A0ACC2GC22_DALPE|nr:hypothetical protein DPEC_G00186920 [Dallia pectoralis]